MWLAKDRDGNWYTYPNKPEAYTGQWRRGGGYTKYVGDRIIHDIYWEESLQNMEEPGPTTQLDRIEARLIAIEEMLKGGQL